MYCSFYFTVDHFCTSRLSTEKKSLLLSSLNIAVMYDYDKEITLTLEGDNI